MNAILEVSVKLPLSHHRSIFDLTQEEFAKEADVKVSTLRYHEQHPEKRISLRTAYKLLAAINRLRTQQGWSGLGLRDIEWEIRE